MNKGMPSAICLNRVGESDRIEGFDDDNCHVGTSYVKANRAFMDIENERQRQISKGYSYGDMAVVAGNLTMASWYKSMGASVPYLIRRECEFKDGKCFLEDNTRGNLVKAAALLIAEVERIDREESGND